MELLPCAAKPVAVAISQGCNTSAGNCAAAAMRGKTCGGCNTSAGNYASAVISGKPLVAAIQARENLLRLKTSAGIHAVELLPCAAKPVAVAI